MAMTPYNGDPNVIAKLGTTPQERGLTTEQFKAKFDEGLKGFVEWFNSTHKTQFDAKAETTSLNALQNEVNEHLADYATQIANRIKKDGDIVVAPMLVNNLVNVMGLDINTNPRIKGIKIKTNIAYGSYSHIVFILEGAKYNAYPIHIIITGYAHASGLINFKASSINSYKPEIKFANENGKVVMFVNEIAQNTIFNISALSTTKMVDNYNKYVGWIYSDASLDVGATGTIIVPYV